MGIGAITDNSTSNWLFEHFKPSRHSSSFRLRASILVCDVVVPSGTINTAYRCQRSQAHAFSNIAPFLQNQFI